MSRRAPDNKRSIVVTYKEGNTAPIINIFKQLFISEGMIHTGCLNLLHGIMRVRETSAFQEIHF